MPNNCKRCGKVLDSPPSSGKVYCSSACRKGEYKTNCPVCGKIFITWNSKQAPRTCGSVRCTKSRKLSKEARQAISHKLSKRRERICPTCNKLFIAKRKHRKYCSRDCVPYTISVESCKKGAARSLEKCNTSSKTESILEQYLPQGYIRNDRRLLDGLEIDYLYDKLAIEYNGMWHYRNFHDHYTSLKERDHKKSDLLKKLGYNYYVVEWAIGNKKPPDFWDIHSYLISQIFEEISPFKFNYDLSYFKCEYDRLRRSRGSKGYLCTATINWYHRYRWFQKTKTHKVNAVEKWECDRDNIIKNRKQYANLDQASLRRYFLLFDYTPSTFSELLAKRLANTLPGHTVYDPFAGYGNRMIGVCAAGKKYIGRDINKWTVNANNAMASDLCIDAECFLGDSSQYTTEADAVLTCPPYEYKDDYGSKSDNDYYDMIAKTFRNTNYRNGFVIVKPSLVNFQLFRKCLPKVRSISDINWGGLGRNSIHKIIEI